MTARDVLRSRWVPLILLAVLALWLAWRLDAGRRAAGEAARLAEAEALRQAGIAVAAQRDAAGMRERLQEVVLASEDLARELARVKAAAKGARPVVVIQGGTGSVPAGGAPRPNITITAVPGAAPPACLLAAGDTGEVRVEQVLLETRGGNVVAAGAASAWRLTPAPATRLFGGPVQARVDVEQLRPEVGWGAGAWAGVGREGWAVGPALALPPLRVWRLQVEAVVGAGLGPGGAWQGGASAVGRWR